MRPLALEVSGFGAFRDETRVDFENAEFFALVGPTGSGKSTVVDAFCFALYGNVPRYDDERLKANVVSLGALEAKVKFTFELEGHRYIAFRNVRVDGKGGTRPAKVSLERIEADGSTTPLAAAVREMDRAVLELIGLDFSDFTKCVVLPQGEFAQFLRAKGKERNDLLSRLLKLDVYERIGRRAREEAAQKRMEQQAGEKRLTDLAHATPQAKAEGEKRVQTLVRLEDELEAARPKDEALIERIRVVRETAEAASAAATALAKITVPDAARALTVEIEGADAVVAEARRVVAQAVGARETAEQTAARLPDVQPLIAAREAHLAIAQCDLALAEASTAAQLAKDADATALAVLSDAEDERQRAQEMLEAARNANAAAAVARSLRKGEPCPVCLQQVGEIPEHAAADIAAAETALKTAEAAWAASDKAHRASGAALTRATAAVEQLEARRRDLAAKVEAHSDASALEKTITQIGEAQRAAAEARSAEDAARQGLEQATTAREKLDERSRKALAMLQSQRDSVAALAPPAVDGPSLVAAWTTLAEWAAAELERQQEAASEARSSADALGLERGELLAGLRRSCATAGVEVAATADLLALIRASASARAAAESQVNLLDKEIAEAEAIRAHVADVSAEVAVAEQLGQLLKTNNFVEWLITEALDLIVADGSRTLLELSGGGFSLTLGPQGEFFVIDHRNADEKRSARTLSGGETFQASLALALALSDQVRHLASDGAPRLDAIFLDEGFGTLDPDSLEVVASTIENLGRDGRVVGVITHVRELAERVPVRFEVAKGVRTSTVERRDA